MARRTEWPGDSADSSRAEKELSPQDPAERARAICLRLLTGTPRTRKQLADALHKREIPAEVAEEIENTIYAAEGLSRDGVAPIDAGEEIAPEMPDADLLAEV